MRTRSGSTQWIALAVLACCACSREEPAEAGQGVLVIAVDALRYDHLGIAGYDLATSPGLDALAREGVFFTSAYAAAPWQVPAHMALLSASDPRLARRVLSREVAATQATLWHLPDDAPHPAAEFLSKQFSTALFYDHANLAPVYGGERGFELYQGPNEDDDASSPDYGSEAVFRRFLQWQARVPQGKKWFAYLEVADLERVWSQPDPRWDTYFSPRAELSTVPPVGDAQHLFFALPRSRWSLGMSTLGEYEARYDGAIARLDAAFRRLRARLEGTNRFKHTTVVVVGAYGMSFGESGLLLDSGTFADVDLHVPLIVKPSIETSSSVGTPSDALVSTIDVLPTLLELAHLKPASGVNGVSFASALQGQAFDGRSEVQASCAFQEGFATFDRRYCFERTWPGRVSDPHLSSSWFGDSERRLDVVREVLHDRLADPTLGHLSASTETSPIAQALRASGEAWAAKIEARRAQLQHELPATSDKNSDGR